MSLTRSNQESGLMYQNFQELLVRIARPQEQKVSLYVGVPTEEVHTARGNTASEYALHRLEPCCLSVPPPCTPFFLLPLQNCQAATSACQQWSKCPLASFLSFLPPPLASPSTCHLLSSHLIFLIAPPPLFVILSPFSSSFISSERIRALL